MLAAVVISPVIVIVLLLVLAGLRMSGWPKPNQALADLDRERNEESVTAQKAAFE